MTRSTRKTSSCPLTALFVALLFCTVADSYNTAATKYCITSRHTQSSSFDTIYSKKLNLNTRDSFSLRNSISQSHSCKRRSTFSSTVQLLVERARAWSGPRGIVMKTLFQKCAVICTMFLSTLLGRSQRVFAASAPLIKNVKGWDLFGRIPHDDWLFTTRALTEPNLMKRTFLESVVTELPDVLMNFRRRKRVNEVWVLGSGLGYCILAVGIAAIAYKGAMESNLRRLEREDNRNGIARKGYGAIAKKGARKGVDIDGMDGWVDMENQDLDDKKKKKTDDDDEEEEEED